MFRPKRRLCFAQTAFTVSPKAPLYIKKELQVFHYNHHNPRHPRKVGHQTVTPGVTMAGLLQVVVVVVVKT
jgi:phosphoribosylaminoimidazole carboxylase (NCAIR synthetase)